MLQRLSTAQVYERLGASNVKVIDVRPADAYNGWRLRHEARGGHIAYAKSLPYKWIRYFDWIDIVRAKRIRPEDSLVIYGGDDREAEEVAHRFHRAGSTAVAVYHDFSAQWCPDFRLPMTRLRRYRHLVPPQWLYSLLDTATAPEYDNDTFVVCHTHYRNRSTFEEGHIPGARAFDTDCLESPLTWNRRSPSELKAALEREGITRDTTVVLYGRCSSPDENDPFPGSSAGHLGAFRCAFIMLYAGIEDVRILNGGLQSWIDAGFGTSTRETPAPPVADFGAAIPQHPELAVDIDEAKRILRNPNANLVCVRSWREFIGEVSGYNYISKKGRIPGAVFADCGADAYHMNNYRNLDHTTREYHEIAQAWADAGIIPEKHNAFYCGTGWRGSEAFFNAWLMGWERISVFDGGWYEWSKDESNPYETGIPIEKRYSEGL